MSPEMPQAPGGGRRQEAGARQYDLEEILHWAALTLCCKPGGLGPMARAMRNNTVDGGIGGQF